VRGKITSFIIILVIFSQLNISTTNSSSRISEDVQSNNILDDEIPDLGTRSFQRGVA